MSRRLAGVFGAVGLVTLVACSAVVSSELDTVKCLNPGFIGPPACPTGTICNAGTCTACLPQEVCANGFDDNCDNRIDEGCSSTGGTGGVSGSPGGGGAPPGGTGGIAGSGALGGGGGTGGVAPGSLGAPCTGPGQCDSTLFCANPTDHGGTAGEMVCTKSCCNSNECWADGVCFGAKGGYNICLPSSRVGRPTPGAKDTGDTCGSGAECRSGVCAGNTCQDTCCSDANCPGNLSTCAYQAMLGSGWQTFTCANKSGSNFGEFCGVDDSACKSDVCSVLCLSLIHI